MDRCAVDELMHLRGVFDGMRLCYEIQKLYKIVVLLIF